MDARSTPLLFSLRTYRAKATPITMMTEAATLRTKLSENTFASFFCETALSAGKCFSIRAHRSADGSRSSNWPRLFLTKSSNCLLLFFLFFFFSRSDFISPSGTAFSRYFLIYSVSVLFLRDRIPPINTGTEPTCSLPEALSWLPLLVLPYIVLLHHPLLRQPVYCPGGRLLSLPSPVCACAAS